MSYSSANTVLDGAPRADAAAYRLGLAAYADLGVRHSHLEAHFDAWLMRLRRAESNRLHELGGPDQALIKAALAHDQGWLPRAAAELAVTSPDNSIYRRRARLYLAAEAVGLNQAQLQAQRQALEQELFRAAPLFHALIGNVTLLPLRFRALDGALGRLLSQAIGLDSLALLTGRLAISHPRRGYALDSCLLVAPTDAGAVLLHELAHVQLINAPLTCKQHQVGPGAVILREALVESRARQAWPAAQRLAPLLWSSPPRGAYDAQLELLNALGDSQTPNCGALRGPPNWLHSSPNA